MSAAGLPLIIARPSPGAETSAARARSMGLDAQAIPLFVARPLAWTVPDPADFDALLLTSANAARLAGPGLAALADLPCHVVGAATEAAARAAGLTPVQTGAGGAQPLLDAMIAAGLRRILWICGRHHMELTAEPASLTPLPCYAVDAVEPPPLWPVMIAQPAVIALYSVRAARQVAALAGDARKHLKCIAISPEVAAAAGSNWLEMAIADAPSDASLLAKADMMCHKGGIRGSWESK